MIDLTDIGLGILLLCLATVCILSCQTDTAQYRSELAQCFSDYEHLQRRLVDLETQLALVETTPKADGFICLPEDRD